MILDSDTNTCYLSKLLLNRNDGLEIAESLTEEGISVKLIDLTFDIWTRDYMPIQIEADKFVGFEYAPDYLYNRQYIHTMTNQARVCDLLDLDTYHSGLILDGGNVVKTSRGIIMVDKVFRENDHLSKISLINRLENAFGCEIIFLQWDRAEYYGHADGIAREIEPRKVLLTNYHRFSRSYFEKFEKVLSQHFSVEVLDYNVKTPHARNWCYINFLQIGKKVFLPQLTDWRRNRQEQASHSGLGFDTDAYNRYGAVVEEDAQAVEQFQRLMPDCKIIPVSCPKIVRDGGALNCISWNIKE